MAKSKFFRVAVEGGTTDGRNIERSWIQDMADTFDPSVRGSRIFAEHIRGIVPDGPFKAYGDVIAVKAEVIADGPLKGKLALYNQIQPTTDMVTLIKSGQKIYPSIEIDPKFSATGKPYQSGLGITDSPASLGVDVITFASQHPAANPFANRKQAPENLFSATTEAVEIELEEEVADTGAKALFKSITERIGKLAGKATGQDAQFSEIHESLTAIAGVLEKFEASNTALTQRFADQVKAVTDRLDAMEIARTKADTDFNELRTQLGSTPSNPARPASTGAGDTQLTDC